MPSGVDLAGARVRLVDLHAASHAEPLYRALEGHNDLWRYLMEEPPDKAEFAELLRRREGKSDPYFVAILDRQTATPLGIAAFLRIEPRHRVIEVGHILFSPRLQRTAHATEAMYLMAKYAFEELGYRRYEWKCNALNGPSRSAALRLGFTFEGIFRQHMIVKGENRDTAWYAMLDGEWPARKKAFEQWLAPENFNEDGSQKQALASLRR